MSAGIAELPVAQEAVVVRPGDTLILRFGPDFKYITVDAADAVKAKIKALLPSGIEVVLVTGEVEQILVVRP